MATPPAPALDNVYWLGGDSGVGKSTIARRLAEGFGLELLSTDDLMAAHAEESAAAEAPLLGHFKRMSMDERWLHRSPQAMLDTFHRFNGEAFDLILRDLRGFPFSTWVLAEGFRLLPERMAPHLLVESRGPVAAADARVPSRGVRSA